MTLIIEICPREPRADFCDIGNASHEDILACTGSGDAEPAIDYLRHTFGVEFRTIAKNDFGKYENRLATQSEIEATARAIYFDSDSDFSDPDTAAQYLIWEATHNFEEE